MALMGIDAVGCPNFLNNYIVVFYAERIDATVGNAIDVDVEPRVEIAVVTIVVDGVLVLLGVGRKQVECRDDQEQKAENISIGFHFFKIL